MASSFVTIDFLYKQNDQLALYTLQQIMVKKMDEQTCVSQPCRRVLLVTLSHSGRSAIQGGWSKQITYVSPFILAL